LHAGHEDHQRGVKAANRVVLIVAEVIAGVEHDEQADGENQERKEKAQRVQAQRHGQSGGSKPLPLNRDGLAADHVWAQRRE
jgi:hypothetical protein